MIEYENLKKLNEPFFKEFAQSFSDTLNSGWYILGKNVNRFENDFALYCGSKHCVGLNSGLDALILAIKAFEFPANTEIIVPANAYIASIMAVILCGFKPVLVEPDLYTYNIDPEKIFLKPSERLLSFICTESHAKCQKFRRLLASSGYRLLKIAPKRMEQQLAVKKLVPLEILMHLAFILQKIWVH